MKRLLIVAGLVVGLGVGLTGYATGQEASIGATVTAQIVSVTVDDGSVAYGTLALGAEKNTIAFNDPVNLDGGADGTQTITNTGTVTSSLALGSGDALGSDDWNLVACASAGPDTFGHQFELNDADSTFVGTEFDASNSTADTGLDLTAAATATLDVGICMPSSTTDSGVHNIAITVLLTEG